MKIQETAKNGVKINIDTPMGRISSNGLITKPKKHIVTYKDSPSDTSKLVDKPTQENYHGNWEELDKLAKDWIELLFNGILEDRGKSFPVILDKKWN